MILTDVNVLIYAHREDAADHRRFRDWMEKVIAGSEAFGIADLVLAIFLGVTSAEGSPLQLFHAAPGSEAMQHLPWSFVPTVLVPIFMILHAIIWVRLRRYRYSAVPA